MTTGGAWVCIAWGVVATGMGLLVATDYRGLVGSMLAERARNAQSLSRVPRWFPAQSGPSASQRVFVRMVGAFFGVAGTVALVVGILALARRAWRLPAFDPHPHLSVVSVVGGVGILALIGWLWRPGSGLIRRGWYRRGIRRVAAVGTTIALLVSAGGWVPMIYPVFLAGWVLAAPGVIILTVRQSPSPERGAYRH